LLKSYSFTTMGKDATAFDMFPRTQHIETLVLLRPDV